MMPGDRSFLSPDGRIEVRYEVTGDPRCESDLTMPAAVVVRDAASGAPAGMFGADAVHDFPAEGGVDLRFGKGHRVRILPDLSGFRLFESGVQFDHVEDGEAVHPMDALPDRLRALAVRDRPEPPPHWPPARAPWWQGVPGCLLLSIVPLAILAMLTPVGDAIAPFLPAGMGDRPGWDAAEGPLPGEVTAWAVTCPGIGPWTFSLDGGRLVVPPRISPVPLPPVEGFSEPGTRRFSDGRTTVEVRAGAEALWWPPGAGGEAVVCRPGMRPGIARGEAP